MSLEEKTKIIGTLSCIQFSFIILKLIGVIGVGYGCYRLYGFQFYL